MNTYGIALASGEYRDVSKTARGAKKYATQNGFDAVYVRYGSGYTVAKIAVKNGKKWGDVK